MSRFFIVILAFVFSLYLSAVEVDLAHAAKTDTLTHTAISVESSFTAPVQTEKFFLPTAEYQLTAEHTGYFAASPHVPLHTITLTSLNNRGPPTTAS